MKRAIVLSVVLGLACDCTKCGVLRWCCRECVTGSTRREVGGQIGRGNTWGSCRERLNVLGHGLEHLQAVPTNAALMIDGGICWHAQAAALHGTQCPI